MSLGRTDMRRTDTLAFHRQAPLAVDAATESHLLCVLDGALLGIEALAVREMLPLPLITPLREAPPQVAGVANVRGALVPVVDVRVALGLAPQTARTSDVLVILERAAEFVALVVSEVRDVRPLRARPIDNGPMTVAAGSGLVAGLAPVGDEIAQLLRLDFLLHLGEEPRSHGFETEHLDAARFETMPGQATGARALFEGVAPAQWEVFAARARGLSRNLADDARQAATQTRSVAAFALGGEYFGLDLSVVREFSPLRSVAPVPCSPPYIAGLMNLRGETLTLIDIGPTLGLPPTQVNGKSAKVVVTQCEGLRLGLVVDEVLDILTIGEAQIAPAAARMAGRNESEIVCDAVFFRDKMLGIIDLPRLLRSDILGAGE